MHSRHSTGFTVTPRQEGHLTHRTALPHRGVLGEPPGNARFQKPCTPGSLRPPTSVYDALLHHPDTQKTSFAGTARRHNWLAARTHHSGGRGAEQEWAVLAWQYAWLLRQSKRQDSQSQDKLKGFSSWVQNLSSIEKNIIKFHAYHLSSCL